MDNVEESAGSFLPVSQRQLLTLQGRPQVFLFISISSIMKQNKIIFISVAGKDGDGVELNVPWTKVPSQEKGKDNSQTRVRHLKRRRCPNKSRPKER